MAKRRQLAPQPQPVPSGAAVVFEPFQKQMQFIEAALSGKFRFLLYGGAIRGGKSFVTLALIIMLCKMYPGSRWAVVRSELPRIRRNVVPTFEKLRPRHFIGEVNRTTWTYTCTNGSEILLVPESIKSDPDGDKWRGFEVNGFVLEEANELTRATYDAAIERAGTWSVPGGGKQPPALVLLTCNPSQSWVKTEFYDPWMARKLSAPRYFLQANADDNPYISDELKTQWESLPKHVYRRFVKGDWSVTDDPMQVIPYEDLHSRLIMEAVDRLTLDGEEALGVDYGGAGGRSITGDLTVFAHGRGATLYGCDGFAGLSQGDVATMIQARMLDRGIDSGMVGIDAIGEGSGVWGNLNDAGIAVRAVIAGGGAWDIARSPGERALELQYRNLKAQMWWLMRDAVTSEDSELQVINDAALVQDLLSVRYRITRERIIEVESKDDTKRRIGRSPDRGDAAVIWNLVRRYGGSQEWGEVGGAGAEELQEHVESLWGGESIWD